MKRSRAVGTLACVSLLAAFLLTAGLSGCGGNGASGLPPEQRVVDSFLRGIVEGDPAAVLACFPPSWLEGLRGEMRGASDEELGTVISQALWFEFPYSSIREIYYRTEGEGGSACEVHYWGVFEKTDPSGNTVTVTVEEAGAQSFQVVFADGEYYLEV